MALRRTQNGEPFKAAPTCTITEHGASDSQDAASAQINGRYPESGYILNRKTDMMIRVVTGIGVIATDRSREDVSSGDVVFIDKQTPYFYDGDFEVFMVSTPPWSSDQYEHVEG